MPKQKKNLAELAVLENEKPIIPLVEEEEQEEIQASKLDFENPKKEDEPIVPVKKPRPPKTAKQLEVFERTRQKGIEANRLRKLANDEVKEEKKKEKEEKIVKTAIVIKKKQIKRERILDNISDGEDDPPKRQKKVVVKPEHQFVFV